ncbi:MAG: altronate dehydratase family protein [Dysgonamonadaceae bacterium]|jgi:altronate hydrolase|nr:altronate dehydratase family protein [Dysgonamonadaceae bacterium]
MRFLKINPEDNVAVALLDLPAGERLTVEGKEITLLSAVPAGHKFALMDIPEGAHLIKYGFPIGRACRDIAPGDWVNEKTIKTNLSGLLDYEYHPQEVSLDIPYRNLTFKGYRRANGEVGVRNEIWVIPTVGCVNGTANSLAERLRRETQVKNVDAIVAYPHNYGCSQLGDDHENTRKILRNMVLHPNAGGVLIVGLGCENNQVSAFRELLGDIDESRVQFIETQKVADEDETGMQMLRSIYDTVSRDRREDVPLSELKVGLKCGGSDGFSGITANPLLGLFSDFLIAQGGSAVLTEVPEMFGAETILMNRCMNKELFDKTVHLINDFKDYFMQNKQPVYENPSPGNKAGGISTLEEKSLGCTQKCGKSPVKDVLKYGDRIRTKGLNLLSAPGNDLVAATALASTGCQLVLFTTGRGTPFGTFVPTVKISTNTPLYQRKPAWIDFNAGRIVENETINEVNEQFINYLIAVASGETVNNEKKDYRETAIFKTGVTL